jgi:hypothetical protein
MTASTTPPYAFRTAQRWAWGQPWLRRFTLANRLLLSMAFLPTGLVKLTGQRFTVLSVDTPVGFFFEAMYQTGPYWIFIGLVQVVAAVLLLIPATATLGAVVFFPVGLSVLLVTWGVGFGTTVFVAAGMLLSVIYLLCWDGDRAWRAASVLVGTGLSGMDAGADVERPLLLEGAHALERWGWILGGVAGMGLMLVTRNFMHPGAALPLLALVGLAAVLVIAGSVRQGTRA